MMPVGKTASGLFSLPLQEVEQPLGRRNLHSVGLPQLFHKTRVLQPPVGGLQELSDPFRKMEVPAALLPLPERGCDPPGSGRQYENVIVGDLLYPPVLGA
jgi:hypothetical protein